MVDPFALLEQADASGSTRSLRGALASVRWRWQLLRGLPDADEVLLARLILAEQLRQPEGARNARRLVEAARSGSSESPLALAIARALAAEQPAPEAVAAGVEAAGRLEEFLPVTFGELEDDLLARALDWPAACLAAGGSSARSRLDRARPRLNAALLAEELIEHLENPRATRFPWIPTEVQIEVGLGVADLGSESPTEALTHGLAAIHGRAQQHLNKARDLPAALASWRSVAARAWLRTLSARLADIDRRGAQVWTKPVRRHRLGVLSEVLGLPL